MLDKADFPDQKGRLIPDIFLSSIQSGRDALRLRSAYVSLRTCEATPALLRVGALYVPIPNDIPRGEGDASGRARV